jgi:hypothetical protein
MDRGYRYARCRNLVATPESSDNLAMTTDFSDGERLSDVGNMTLIMDGGGGG